MGTSKTEPTSTWLKLSSRSGEGLHVISYPSPAKDTPPLVLLHGLGSSSSFWVTPLLTSRGQDLLSSRRIIAYDFDGHGLSEWSGRDRLTVQHLAEDLKELLDTMGVERAVIGAHSMSATVATLFAQQYPAKVEGLFLLNPVRNLSVAAQQSMRARATLFGSLSSRSALAFTISTTAISKWTLETSPAVSSFIRHLVLSTRPEAYSAACLALAEAPEIGLKGLKGIRVCIIGGENDYLTRKEALGSWLHEMDDSKQGNGRCIVLENVGHWGAIEDPEGVTNALGDFLK